MVKTLRSQQIKKLMSLRIKSANLRCTLSKLKYEIHLELLKKSCFYVLWHYRGTRYFLELKSRLTRVAKFGFETL